MIHSQHNGPPVFGLDDSRQTICHSPIHFYPPRWALDWVKLSKNPSIVNHRPVEFDTATTVLINWFETLLGGGIMPIEIMDMVKMARDEGKRKKIFNTKKLHAWLHVYPKPGDKDDMHCHNADQTFYVIDGECTMHFPDGGKAVMKPGMVATITGGSFYQLENTGTGPMVLMGNRSGPSEAIQHINYELRKDIKTLPQEEMEKIRHAGGARIAG
jgi:mannose-6-phosphate isomerase-like protein (cupin superfamily)